MLGMFPTSAQIEMLPISPLVEVCPISSHVRGVPYLPMWIASLIYCPKSPQTQVVASPSRVVGIGDLHPGCVLFAVTELWTLSSSAGKHFSKPLCTESGETEG